MRIPGTVFVLLLSGAVFGQAPQQNWIQQNWFPPVIENLRQNSSSRTEFDLDHSMVVLASKVDDEDDSLRRVVAGVDGISVHRFRFPADGMYDPRILNAVRSDYRAAGWQHIGNAHDKYGYPKASDLWLHLQHNTITNIAFLIASPNQVNLVSISGSISPIDLLHLAGHFGIPRIQAGVTVPDQRVEREQGPPADEPPPYDTQSAPPAQDSAGPDQGQPAPDASAPPSDDDYRHPRSESNDAPPLDDPGPNR